MQLLFIIRRTEQDIAITAYRSACKVPLFLSDCNETWIFATDFRKKQISNFMKIRPIFPCGRIDGDRHTLIVAFRNC